MTRRFEHLPDIEAFVAVVELGSMTAAAVRLSTTPSVVSRAIARLEHRLCCQLLRRSTRRINLTDQGRQYWEQAQNALTLIEDVERELQDSGTTPRGRVRLTAPTTYGNYLLPQKLAAFAQKYPAIALEVCITNRNVDLVSEGFDMAIRLGKPPEREIQARLLETAALCLVAAPEYVARYGEPRNIADLAQHQCLSFSMPSTGRVLPWEFLLEGKAVEWQPPTAVTVADDVLATVSLALQGMGICQTYDFVVEERIAQGTLLEVLPGLRGRSRPFHVLYPPRKRLTTATRLLAEHLIAA